MEPGHQLTKAVETGGTRFASLTSGERHLRNVEVFERSWRRERSVSGIPYLSRPPTWPLALGYDSAVLNLDVSETQVLGGGSNLTLTVTFEDSADGIHWAQIGTAQPFSNPSGAYRIAAPTPFAAFLKVNVEIEASGLGNIGLAEFHGAMTFRRSEAKRPMRDVPNLDSSSNQPEAKGEDDDCGCSG